MAEPIDFYFDFTSPYGYIAAHQIDQIGDRHGRAVRWHPFLLGAVFKLTNMQPPIADPMKGPYALRDFARSARLAGLPFRMPASFPFHPVAAARGFYWADAVDPERAKRLALAIYARLFAQGPEIHDAGPTTPEMVADLAADVGFDRDACLAGIGADDTKARLRAAGEQVVARGVFGSPFFLIDGEPFFGADRLGQVDRWLETGGW
ncbi:2-hydroxychromene-2-carboxylate isomerase [Tistrella bauzanensis]|uniref:2-hydroxychromene-2-carboxylate isomerase n=1 Tax=Tistrella arctica TaxID=3133430 RepID=A0ABU9YN32_9PROT